MATHDGHRQRMRQRFREEGLDHFTDVQVLEMLLFYCIPLKDTNPIAHDLLEQFGSLSQVLEAPISELQKVPGIGENAAVFLHLVREAGRFYQTDRINRVQILSTVEDCAEYLVPHFLGRQRETVFLLCLDAKCKVLCCAKLTEGNVNTAGLSPRKVVEQALTSNAATVVLAHNHPGGLAIPSQADIETTKKVAAALSAVDVILLDHVIVADGDYVSMLQSGISFR